MPDGVREVTARRLRRLTADARQALQVASVIGREFDYDVLEAVAPLHDDELVSALEEGVEARVLRESGPVGRYAFTHALVRATLYDGLSQLRRARLHGRVGEAIARLRGADLDPQLPALAHHFAQAAPVEQPERAIDFALAAARRADRLLAWEEAAQHYRAALRTRELVGAPRGPRAGRPAARARRVRGPRRHGGRGARHVRRRRRHRARARRRARCSAAPHSASPASGRSSVASTPPAWRCSRRRWPRSATRTHRCAPGCSPGWRSSSTTRASRSGGSRCPSEAVDLARRLGDPRTLATCLDARHYALWRPENVNERLEVASELRRVAEETGDPELELEGAGWTVVDLLELGDIQGADIQIAAASQLAEALQRPIWLWWSSLLRCTRAQLVGHFDDAERLAEETLEIGRRGQAENALNAYAQAMFNIRREQGRLGEVEPAVRGFIEVYPMLVAWRAALALMLIELGRTDEARTEFEARRRRGPAARRQLADRRSRCSPRCAARSATASAPRRCTTRSSRTRAATSSSAGRRPATAPPRACSGSSPARCAQWELAEGHFISALAMHERMGARPWVARTQLAYAEMLLTRRQRGDKARARELLADAVVIADALGMGVVAQRARDLVPAGAAGPGGAVANVT